MEKKVYEEPDFNVVVLLAEDILSASDDNDDRMG